MGKRNHCHGWLLGASLILKSNSGFDVLFAHTTPASLCASRNGREWEAREEGLDLTPAGMWRLQGSAARNNHGLLNT